MTNTGTLVSLWARTHSRYLWPGCPKRPASPSNIRAYEPFHSGHLHNKAFGSVTMATSEHRSVESLNIKTARPRCKLVGQQHCSTTSRMAAPTSTRHLPSRRQELEALERSSASLRQDQTRNNAPPLPALPMNSAGANFTGCMYLQLLVLKL